MGLLVDRENSTKALLSSGVAEHHDVKVIVAKHSLEQLESGSIFGRIHVNFETSRFPAEDWTDFAVVILSWWLDALSSDQPGIKQLTFMDGPYEVNISKNGELAEIRGFKAGSLIASCPGANFQRFVQSVIVAAETCLNVACQRGWETKDTRKLETIVRSAKRILNR
jgi:hypothetical protein